MIAPVPPARHLLRAKDLIDARYRDPLDVPALARAARQQEPTDQPYGIDAGFRDPSGNQARIVQSS